MTPRIYIVGGFVRDTLLKRAGFAVEPQDRDFVVVGATPQFMLERGFLPVGADFPVFLHPETHEEYALARTERKTAPGYRGFVFHASPEVTLEEDLRRRDLTVNAIAMDREGRITDPWGGAGDIERRVFRHVSPAFREDPVRILRVARFCARLPQFRIARQTQELLRTMVANGEVDALVPERVLRELTRGLMEKRPSRMLQVLHACGAWERVAGGLAVTEPILRALDLAAERHSSLECRFAILTSQAGPEAENAARALRASGDLLAMARLSHTVLPALALPPRRGEIVPLLEKADFFRRPERFAALLAAARCLADSPLHAWQAAAGGAKAVPAREVIARAASPRDIPKLLREAREEAAIAALQREKSP